MTFAGASLVAIAIGAAVMLMADVPISIAIRNPIAWLVAGGIALVAPRRSDGSAAGPYPQR